MKDDDLDVFRDIVRRTDSLEECISEIKKVKIDSLTAYKFYNTYGIDDNTIEESVQLFRDDVLKEPVNKDREFLKELSALYAEHRSDVTDIVDMYLNDQLPKNWKESRESRFVEADFEGWKVEYDTLTTLMHFKIPDGKNWYPCVNHKYSEE